MLLLLLLLLLLHLWLLLLLELLLLKLLRLHLLLLKLLLLLLYLLLLLLRLHLLHPALILKCARSAAGMNDNTKTHTWRPYSAIAMPTPMPPCGPKPSTPAAS